MQTDHCNRGNCVWHLMSQKSRSKNLKVWGTVILDTLTRRDELDSKNEWDRYIAQAQTQGTHKGCFTSLCGSLFLKLLLCFLGATLQDIVLLICNISHHRRNVSTVEKTSTQSCSILCWIPFLHPDWSPSCYCRKTSRNRLILPSPCFSVGDT